jgi:hypothetical protein
MTGFLGEGLDGVRKIPRECECLANNHYAKALIGME